MSFSSETETELESQRWNHAISGVGARVYYQSKHRTDSETIRSTAQLQAGDTGRELETGVEQRPETETD